MTSPLHSHFAVGTHSISLFKMMRSSAALLRLRASTSTVIHLGKFQSLLFSTDTTTAPPQVRPEPPPLQPHTSPDHEQQRKKAADDVEKATKTASQAAEAEDFRKNERIGEKVGEYEKEQERVLRAALDHVLRFGWSESALIAGARDVGISPAIVGSLPRKEAALVEFFMNDCLQRLIDKIDSGENLGDLVLSDKLSKLIRIRLEMQVPYISRWPQALSIQAQPMNLPTSFKQRALLVDEFWHSADDQGSDIDWYVKRTILSGIYSTSEIFMLTDNSPEFRDTWAFVHRRVKDAFDLQKTVQEATYLAEAVGAGMGSSVQGFMKKLFQG